MPLFRVNVERTTSNRTEFYVEAESLAVAEEVADGIVDNDALPQEAWDGDLDEVDKTVREVGHEPHLDDVPEGALTWRGGETGDWG